MRQKLKIIGPYTPEHKGPFCTRDGRHVEIAIRKDRRGKILGYRGDDTDLTSWEANGQFDHTRMSDTAYDLMSAEEVPQPREFWANEYSWGFGPLMPSFQEAIQKRDLCRYIRTIHVREVLPGEGE